MIAPIFEKYGSSIFEAHVMLAVSRKIEKLRLKLQSTTFTLNVTQLLFLQLQLLLPSRISFAIIIDFPAGCCRFVSHPCGIAELLNRKSKFFSDFSPHIQLLHPHVHIGGNKKKFDTIQLLCVAVFILVLAVFFFLLFEIASFSSLFILFRSFSDCQFRGGREKIPLFSRSPSSVLYHRSVDDDNDDDDVLALMEMFIVIAFGIVVL